MEHTGQLTPFPLDRKLSEQERKNQLKQSEKINIPLLHQLTVIEFNSNWVEVVDKFFFDKGALTFAAGIAFAGIMVVNVLAIIGAVIPMFNGDFGASVLFLLLLIGLPFNYFAWKTLRKEINYTHYPIRFNRKTKTIHVFRQDGSVLNAKWNDVFFTRMPLPRGAWDIVGHILDKDGITVRETFALPATTMSSKDRESSMGYWEFIRRYMEEGPASVSDVLSVCLPIKYRKETLAFSYKRVALSLGSHLHPFILFYYIFYPARMIAMHFSKIPQWPAEIEAQCPRLEGHDPFFRDASMNT
ncbi:hypothetical protein JFK97_00355 [Chromobacterium phragmitis]|uniref:DUF6708 domain-containing protein n=1 Tax=Chromobacterium amazonense TaxID=1382803 RepID=UPI0021B75C00|nr:DUF6708 domain-containing protein [Chromobacterium amazonense]MBM2882841.1 hypothetical protein [Chromobacterium amazonense]MDE1716463.1 hypothetical protein [Chromobacterium amazonense]